MEYNKLITGNTYKLKDLFSKDNKIIIPDLQRDYCWGTTKNKDGDNLVSSFLSNLLNNKDNDLNLGLLYGYEAPLGHIQLCDGQQRITTLFLLLGMLNKKSNDAFRHYLISETEENDDWEPYLQYAIRESSLYFLSDLTRYFFIGDKNLQVSEIIRQPWYFKDYDLDPSIQSMIAAMEIIEKEFMKDDCFEFGNFVAEKLSFLYYDMENRTKGEETFVVINTTGEPLSATENLKPLLISSQLDNKRAECAETWEKWEQFFWKNRGKNDTADNGLKEFFRWIMLLSLNTDSAEFKQIQKDGVFKFDLRICFDIINKYFQIISEEFFPDNNALFRNNKIWLSPELDCNTQITWFRLLPVLQYRYRFPDASERDIRRVKMFFRNIAKNPNVQKAISETFPEAIRIIKELPNRDICSVLDLNGISETILSLETKYKLKVYTNSPKLRDEIEDAFWDAEDHPYTRGSIACISKESINDQSITTWDRARIDDFKHRFCVFKSVFSKENTSIQLSCPPAPNKICNAMITRALLACYGDYSYNTGGNNWCFGYNNKWEEVIAHCPKAISELINQLIIASNLYSGMESIITNYVNTFVPEDKEHNSMFYVVKYPNSLQSLNYGFNILRFYDDDWNYWINILNKERASSYNINIFVYLVYKQLVNKTFVKNQWLQMEYEDLQLDCAQHSHGWTLRKADNCPIQIELSEIIKQKLSKYEILLNEEKQLYIHINTNDDLIEEGVNIIETLCKDN